MVPILRPGRYGVLLTPPLFDIGWEERKRSVLEWIAAAGGKVELWEGVISKRAIWIVFTTTKRARWLDDLPKPESLPGSVRTHADHTGQAARDAAFADAVQRTAQDVQDKVLSVGAGIGTGALLLLAAYLFANSSSGGERRRRSRYV